MGIQYKISDNVDIAYKLDEEALISLNTLLISFANDIHLTSKDDTRYYIKEYDKPRYNVEFKDNSSKNNLNFEELLNLSNAGSKEIINLEADANLPFYKSNINIWLNNTIDFNIPIRYRLVCDEESLYYKYQTKIIEFMEQIEQTKVYSKVRTNNFVFVYLVYLPILFLIIFTISSFGFENLLLRLINHSIFITVLLTVGLPFVGVIIKNVLLPSGEIHIGKGEDRAENLKNIRRFILGTVLFTLLIELIYFYRT